MRGNNGRGSREIKGSERKWRERKQNKQMRGSRDIMGNGLGKVGEMRGNMLGKEREIIEGESGELRGNNGRGSREIR